MTKNNGYLDRAALLTACVTLKEQDLDIPELGKIKLRELTAQQRLDASQAARGEDGQFDGALFNALIVQMGVLDGEGQPLLTPADVEALLAGRGGFVAALSDKVWALSEASLDHLKSGN